ncbi:MAG: SDR family NAD(P)-dependent oxidoreductase [Xanthobacteraceae bacterium]
MPNISTHRGRAAVVTGSGCGIGAAIALEFARRGANVVCADLQQRSETVSSIGAAAIGVAADVADPDGWAAIARRGIVPNVIDVRSIPTLRTCSTDDANVAIAEWSASGVVLANGNPTR